MTPKEREALLSKLPKNCGDGDPAVCDFCIHFLFYRDKDGMNIDGSGWCGLHKKEVDAGYGCKNYYCQVRWKKNMKKFFSGKSEVKS